MKKGISSNRYLSFNKLHGELCMYMQDRKESRAGRGGLTSPQNQFNCFLWHSGTEEASEKHLLKAALAVE